MKVTLLLADAAQAVNGKLYVLGGGWSLTGPEPSAMALAVKIEVPWDRANIKHRWLLQLLDEDGAAVELPSLAADAATQPIRIEGEFEAGRPAGLKAGTPLDVTLAFNFAPLPLTPGRRYVWQLSIADFEDAWQVAFSTRPGSTPAAT